ncbi:MAG: PfkB family carbohydrate kinase, partial [Candidatus Omnitrophica bacterium]|nr:PfkB family carbohydrate kinase [Candidatus Omnitrophota bacterium]
ETLASFSSVDFVASNHAPTATNCIRMLKPHIYVKGQDYLDKSKDVTGKINEEEEAILSVGGRMVFTHDITFSSSKLINEHMQVFPENTRNYLKAISAKYSLNVIFATLDKIKDLKILVIGEAIIDQYHYCEGMDKSRKSNVVVYKYQSEESFAGGSLAVANHIAGLTKNVTLVTMTGNDADSFAPFLKQAMDPSVKLINFARPDGKTIVTRRFVNVNQKLFEICYLDDALLKPGLEKYISQRLRKIVKDFDLVVVSDFGHGFLTDNLVKVICKEAKFLAVNTQTNGANMGFNFITRYLDVDYAALDELEIRYAAGERAAELSRLMRGVSRKINCRNLIVTRGNHGALSLSKDMGLISAPALATDVVDPIGAGDAFFAFTAPLMAMRLPQDLVTLIGNAVGALAVKIICNRDPVDPVDLKKFITTILK